VLATVDLESVADHDVGTAQRSGAGVDRPIATGAHVDHVEVAPRDAVGREGEGEDVRWRAEAAFWTVGELGARTEDADDLALWIENRVSGFEAMGADDEHDRGLAAGVEPSSAGGDEVLACPDRWLEAGGGPCGFVSLDDQSDGLVPDEAKHDRGDDDRGRADHPGPQAHAAHLRQPTPPEGAGDRRMTAR
jgi:hypothetical protein